MYINDKPIYYVDQYYHFGKIISADLNDRNDALHRRNAMTSQINIVLCYFSQLDNFVKLKLLKAYCSSLYSSVLWDLDHSFIESVYSG